MELTEKSVLDNDFKNIENLITLKTFDIHENVSGYSKYNIVCAFNYLI